MLIKYPSGDPQSHQTDGDSPARSLAHASGKNLPTSSAGVWPRLASTQVR